ncbi:MAG: O-antigen ligase family protein [Candidatus Saganbacteria bacterium]|nr:O-antigen ligase family protein [Candidatus Saganbacteria bacterium]
MGKNRRELKAEKKQEKHGNGWLTFDFAVELMLLVITFLIPVIFDRRLGIVFSGTKVTWLRAFVIVVLALWAGKLLITRQHRFVRTPLDWPVAAYILLTTAATLTAVHVYTSFAGFYGRFEGLSTWYLLGLLFFITTNYVRSFEQLKRLIAAVVSAGTLMSVYGVINRQGWDPYLWGGVPTKERVIGTIGQPNFLAAYILMAFFLALVLFMEERGRAEPFKEINWWDQLLSGGSFLAGQALFVVMIYTLDAGDVVVWYTAFALVTAATLYFCFTFNRLHPLILKLLLGVCIMLIYVCLLYTQSRGGYLGFFAGAVFFAFVVGRQWLFKHWREFSLISLLILIISGVTMMNPEYSPIERFAGEISVKKTPRPEESGTSQLALKGAAGSRGETWKSGYKILADNPLFGIGPEDLKMVFPRYETDLFRFKETFHVKQDRNHNESLDVPVTKGLLAMFAYLWALYVLFKVGLERARAGTRAERLMAGGLLAAALAYVVQNQFSFGVVAITSLFWTIWGMVMVLGRETELSAAPGPARLTLNDVPWLPLTAVAAVVAFLLWASFLSFRGDIYFKSGKTNLEMKRLPQAVGDFQRSLAVFPLEGTTVSHLAIAYLNLNDLPAAAKTLAYGTRIDPFNADNFYMLARLNLSRYDQGSGEALAAARDYNETALKIDPYYAEAYENRGLIAERLGRPGEALDHYEKAFSVNPNVVSVITRMTVLGKALGRQAEVRRTFSAAFERFPQNLEVFKALEQLK